MGVNSDKSLYIDLLITGKSFTLNSGNEPLLCDNRASISQDVTHSIIESGLASELIGERSPTLRADITMQMVALAESDVRLIPGTVFINEERSGHYVLTAETYDFGVIQTGVTSEQA